MAMKKIVVATDGSAGARAAVREGVELAREFSASLTFVHVRPPLGVLGEPYYQRRLSEQLAHARAAVDQALADAAERGIEADAEILEGEPAEEIVRLAAGRKADLIVVGSRGLGAVAGALLGSVSRMLVQRADRPVLVVKEDELAGLKERAERWRTGQRR